MYVFFNCIFFILRSGHNKKTNSTNPVPPAPLTKRIKVKSAPVIPTTRMEEDEDLSDTQILPPTKSKRKSSSTRHSGPVTGPATGPATADGPADDFVSFVKSLKGENIVDNKKGKAKVDRDASPSGSDNSDCNARGDEQNSEGDSEEEEEEEEEEGEEGNYSVKEEVEHKVRHPKPKRGKPNAHSCDRCVKMRQTCYSQDSTKARSACFQCGKLKNKCIYSVSIFLILIYTE
jgi:ribosomal protein L12E/L44/L45/RPP1/RPP2